MRLWSLHPRLLDARGLVALWREGLLARAVLAGKTLGYTRHPQLERFRAAARPLAAIDAYLHRVRDEALRRGYAFDVAKLGPRRAVAAIAVPRGQLAHEWAHLLAKLARRDRRRWRAQRGARPEAHPSFRVIAGGVAAWERLTRARRAPARSRARPRRSEGRARTSSRRRARSRR